MKIANGLDFINDEAVIGKWENIGWTESTSADSITDLNDVSGEFHILYFLPDGEPYWIYEGWTKGVLLIHYGGNEPILSYKYEIRSIDDKPYLFVHLENKTEVFIKRDSLRYNKETLGRHDDINKPFVSDDAVLGKWRSVAFLEGAADFNENDISQDLYLSSIEFFPDGSLIQSYMDTTWYDKWTNMDTINDLTELGFIQNPEMDKIVLYPLVQEIIISDLNPDTENCRPLLDNIHRICLQHGVDIPYYSSLFSITENIVDKIALCDKADYLLFIEDCFSYMEKYRYASGMKKLVSAMSDLLSGESVGTQNDRALLLNNQASCEGLLNGNYKKAIDLEKRAINMCVPKDNPFLAANLQMNLGYLYQADGKTDLAKPSMEKALQIIAEVNAPTHDVIIMSRNYTRLLAETGEAHRAITALQKCADFVKATNSETTADYADLLFDIAGITSQLSGIQAAEQYFVRAFKIYRDILTDDDLREKAALTKYKSSPLFITCLSS